jgi:hypothetical protein
MPESETEIELEYRLSAEQRELWRDSLPKLRSSQVDVAKQLHKVSKGELGSWKNAVSGFLKGDEVQLRSVFGEPKRARILADALLGVFPILEALHPSPLGRGSSCSEIRPPNWSLEALVEITRAKPAQGGRIVAVIDELDLDAKPALSWLEARLELEGKRVSDWRDPDLGAGSIVLQSDFDSLSHAEREQLLASVRAADAVLFVTTTIDDHGEGWPSDQIVYQPGRGTIYWAAGYLEHLEAVLANHGFAVDFSALRDWLEDDPRSSWATERAHSLGVVARHVFDGKALPFTGNDLLRQSIERAQTWLVRRKLRGEARLLELCGARALGQMAAQLCKRGAVASSYGDVASHFVDAAVGVAGPEVWARVAVAGMVGLVEELVACGLLREHVGMLSTTQHQLSVVALGHHLASQLDDRELVQRAATQTPWQGAFLAAVEAIGDPSPVVEVLMRCSDGVRHVGVPALTMALECDARPSDVEAFGQAHLHALRWWATRPPPHRVAPRTIHYGRQKRHSALAANAHQLGGRSALVALGQASLRHRDVLPSDWTPATLLALEPDRAQAALGHMDLDHERAEAVLVIGAPFQAACFHDPQPWRCRDDRVDDPNEPIALGLTSNDHALWWRTVAVPRLREEPDSDARLVGAKPGFSVTVAMRQNQRGTRIWSEALARVLAAGLDGSQDAFVSVVLRLVEIDGRHNFEAVQSIWHQLRPDLQSELRRQVRRRLAQRQERYWALDDDQSAWLMREFFDSDGLLELWTVWRDADQPRWRPFLFAGLSPSHILDWALEDGDHDSARILRRLVAIDSPEFLVEMELRVPERWWIAVHRRLAAYDGEQVGRLRLDALQRWPTSELRRSILAGSIDPRVGSEQQWLSLAASETRELEHLTRLVQADLASQREDPWQHTLGVLDRLVEILDSPLEHLECHHTTASGDADNEELARYYLGERVSDLLLLLGRGLNRDDPPPARQGVIERVINRPRLRARILGGVCWPWWAVARGLFGDEYVLGILREGHDDCDQASLSRLRSMGLPRNSLLALTGDVQLGPSAAIVLADQIADGVLDTLEAEEIADLLADPHVDLDSDAVHTMVSSCLNNAPWSLDRLAKVVAERLGPDASSSWWRRIASYVSEPGTLARLLDALLKSDVV